MFATDYSQAQRNAFGDALRTARGQRSTSDLIGQLPGYKSAGSITHWERGETPPPPPVVFALEGILGLPAGHLSQHLGFLPVDADAPPCTVESALSADADLTPAAREVVRMAYREFKASAGR